MTLNSTILNQVTQNQMCHGTRTTRRFLKAAGLSFCTRTMACVLSWSEISRLKTEESINALQATGRGRYSVVVNCLWKVSLPWEYFFVLNFADIGDDHCP